MISIQTTDGQLIKNLSNFSGGTFGFHKLFGFISELRAKERIVTRKRRYFDYTSDSWNFSFDLKRCGNDYEFKNLMNCEITSKDQGGWILNSQVGSFEILNNHAPLISALQKGKVKIRKNGSDEFFEINGGVIEVLNNKILILAE